MDEFEKNLAKSEMYENNDLYASMSMEPPENFKELNADINFQDGTISTVGVNDDDLPFLLKTEKSNLIQELKNKVDNNEKIEPSFLNKLGGIVEGFKSWTMSAPLSDYNIAIDKASLQIGDSITQFNKFITGGTIGKLFDNQPRIFRLSQEGKADITIRATNKEVEEQFYNMSAEFRKFGKYHPFDDNGELKEGWQEITEFVATSDEIEYTNKNFTPAPFLEYGLAYGAPGIGFYKGLGKFETFKKFPMWIQVLLAETGVEFAMASQKKDDVNLGNLFKAFGIGDIDETTPEFLRSETSLMTKYINLFRESVAADLDDTAFERKWKNASGNAPIGAALGLVLQFFKMAKKFKYNKKGREQIATNVDQEVVVDKGMDGEYKVYDQNGLETGGFKTQEEAEEFAESLGEGFEAKSLGAAATPTEPPTPAVAVDSSGQIIKQADELVPSEKPFYSNVEKTISNFTFKQQPGNQILATLNNTAGIKQSEIQDLGLDTFLKDNPSVTKEELDDFIANKSLTTRVNEEILDTQGKEQLDFYIGDDAPEIFKKAKSKEEAYEIFMNELNDPALLKEFEQYKKAEINAGNIVTNGEHFTNFFGDKFGMMDVKQNMMPTKYDDFVTPGGSKYKEILITVPGTPRVFTKHHYQGVVPRGENLIAHARFNERTIDNKKILFVEEIQSDLHQAGRKQGYSSLNLDAEVENINSQLSLLSKAMDESKAKFDPDKTQEYMDQYNKLLEKRQSLVNEFRNTVADAPFKNNWHELTMKRLIKYAIDNGFDGISFTTGKMQNDRYDLAQKITALRAEKIIGGTKDGQYDLTITPIFGEQKSLVVKESDLERYVGKDLSAKIIEDAPTYTDGRNYTGLDLEFGGDGMKGFYDKILPSYLSKFGKKFGANLEKTELDVPAKTKFNMRDLRDFEYNKVYDAVGTSGRYASYKIKQNFDNRPEKRIEVIQIKDGKETVIHRSFELNEAKGILLEELDGFNVPQILENREAPQVPIMFFTPDMKKEILTEGVPIAQVEEQEEKNTALV